MVKGSRSKEWSRRRDASSRYAVPRNQSVFGFTRLTRVEAIHQAATLLRRSPSNMTALRLIHLFHLDYEELASAGVPYELLRAIEPAMLRL
jgi:hypothetical protein